MTSSAPSLQQLARARVLVVGDAMLDRYWHGSVDRISPEAPVPPVTKTLFLVIIFYPQQIM